MFVLLVTVAALMMTGLGSARAAEPDSVTVEPGEAGTVTGAVQSGPDAPRPWYQQPGWIATRSLVVPGWGQASNGAWIKAVVVAGAEVAMIVKVVDDEKDLNALKDQIDAAVEAGDGDTEAILVDVYNEKLTTQTSHRWWLGGILLVSMVDAYVDAHFRGFKVKFDRDPALDDAGNQRVSMYYRWAF